MVSIRILLSTIVLSLVWAFSAQAAPVKQTKQAKKEIKKALKEKRIYEKEMRSSQRAMWIAHVLRQKKESQRIPELSLEFLKIPVFLIPKADSFRPLVQLKLNFKKKGWKLLDSSGQPIRKAKGANEYILYAYLNSRISTVDLIAKGPEKGQEQLEKIYLFAPEAREFKTSAVLNSVQFFVGHTYLNYRQRSVGKYVANSLLLGAKYMSPEKGEKIGYLADVSSTVYTYDSSPIQRSANFLEGRAAATYKLKLFKDPQKRSRVFAGVSTINLFSLGSAFGFSGLYGPNLGLRTEYYKTGVNSYTAELQFTPYEFKDPLAERSLKLSLEWNKNLDSTRRAQLGLSYANHEFTAGVDEFSAHLLSVYFSLSF